MADLQTDADRPAVSVGLPAALLGAFGRAFPGETPAVFVRAPGRVNLLGGHVDMHGGMVINIAIDRAIWLAAAHGLADLAHVYAADLDASVVFSLRRLDERVDAAGHPLPRWANYPAGVAWALQRRGVQPGGLHAAFLGHVAMRAGLSSSAAVEVAFAIAWQALNGWRLAPGELMQVGHAVERDYLRLGTGIQDQFTCLFARQDHALWLDCRALEHGYLVLPPTARVVICDTGTRRELVGSGYKERAEDAHAAARAINRVDGQVQMLRDVTPERLEAFRPVLTAGQYRRARHVITEIARVGRGLRALEQGDVAAFGALMNESYFSARDDYGSSSPALDAMWSAATQHPGCYGARYSGGGEAGVIVALVAAGAVEDFLAATADRYARAAGRDGQLYVVEPAQGADVVV